MANEEHVALLKQGADVWNKWRDKNPAIEPDLDGASLKTANLEGVNLTETRLAKADLRWANLIGARLAEADLREAKLVEAKLVEADLREAKLVEADLVWANLTGAKLVEADLREAILREAILIEANLREANLEGASLRRANLRRANLTGASLFRADLGRASLFRADLGRASLELADLRFVDFLGAILAEANLEGATFGYTVLAFANLSNARGLEQCAHHGPSIVDHHTIRYSGKLPDRFLRGCGVPDSLIDYFPSLLNDPIQFYSCFISYSSKDDAFARRLHADLQDNGVRCWFAPEDLKIGQRLGETIDEAIRLRDKLLLILSETSTASAWVTKEVRTALEEEERHGKLVLFPVRVDDAVLNTTDQWAHDIKRNRHIGNFTGWKNHDEYQKGLERLLRDLKVEAE